MPVRLPVLSPWRAFVERWADCRDCVLCETRKNIVLARGSVPCDVLFIGEAPGESEDVIGQPFMGPAGKLLGDIVSRALGGPSESFTGIRTAFTNLVCCIPRNANGGKATEPDPNEVIACQPRLAEFIALCRPRLIVCVGALASRWIGNQRTKYGIGGDVRIIDIIHPAAILRSNSAQQGMAIQRAVVQIANAVEEL